MQLTKEYFDEQVSRLVTKEQAKSFASKDDLSQFATKDDLLAFANKDDLFELATKNDLGTVRSDIAEVKQVVDRLNQREDEDTRALLRDVADLQRRVSALER